jgi:hypothetical protein
VSPYRHKPHGLAVDFDVILFNNTKGKFEMFDFTKRVLQRRLQSVQGLLTDLF